MELSRSRILLVTLLVEGSLIALYVSWLFWRGYQFPGLPTSTDILNGLIFCLPLLIFNLTLFGPLSNALEILKPCRQFKADIILPLARKLDFPSAVLISSLAGLGEELFFRGILQTEFGLIVASLSFALLHFGTAICSYIFIGSLYLLFGFYFGLMFETTGSLWAVIFTHALYDLIVILYLKHFDSSKEN